VLSPTSTILLPLPGCFRASCLYERAPLDKRTLSNRGGIFCPNSARLLGTHSTITTTYTHILGQTHTDRLQPLRSKNIFIPPHNYQPAKLSPPPNTDSLGRSYNLSEMPPIRQTASPTESPGIMPQGIKRSRQACDTCRRKKSRCTGEKPVCATCRRLKQECSYKESFMSSFPDRYKDFESQVLVSFVTNCISSS